MSLVNALQGFNLNSLQGLNKAAGSDPNRLLAQLRGQGGESLEGLMRDPAGKVEQAIQGSGQQYNRIMERASQIADQTQAAGPAAANLQQAKRAQTADAASGFGNLISDLVNNVDAAGKKSESEVRKVLSGESDNLHQAMISMQEAGVAMNLLIEVRNKLIEGYQQLSRMTG
jgi:flagellar hook-basal body complex protein FliE